MSPSRRAVGDSSAADRPLSAGGDEPVTSTPGTRPATADIRGPSTPSLPSAPTGPARTCTASVPAKSATPRESGSTMLQADSTSSARAKKAGVTGHHVEQQSLVAVGHRPFELAVEAEVERRLPHIHPGVGHFRLEEDLNPFGRLNVNDELVSLERAPRVFLPVDEELVRRIAELDDDLRRSATHRFAAARGRTARLASANYQCAALPRRTSA